MKQKRRLPRGIVVELGRRSAGVMGQYNGTGLQNKVGRSDRNVKQFTDLATSKEKESGYGGWNFGFDDSRYTRCLSEGESRLYLL